MTKLMRTQKPNNLGIWLIGILILSAACQSAKIEGTPTPAAYFVPPTPGSESISVPENPLPPTPTRQRNCTNQLSFLKDLTIPDGMEVKPGQKITKRWRIQNDGSCDWDQSYSFELISGLSLGAKKKQDLYPLKGGSKGVLEITFTAPDNPGRYNTWWQAYDPRGNRFGDPVYMDITVVNE